MELLTLQGNIKRDAEGYADDFQLQLRHYQACLDIFRLKPSKNSQTFADLITFVAQVAACYPQQTKGVSAELMDLLDAQHAVLDPSLRQALVKALILMRNRGQTRKSIKLANKLERAVSQVTVMEVLPLFFRLFRCQDKGLRQLLFRHIVSDIKAANQRQRNDRLNRRAQSFLYGCLSRDGEVGAKPALAVLTELWRRQVWRDARTVNVIASAVFHPSVRIMLAAIKFFLGQDAADAGNSDDDDDSPPPAAAGPSKADLYKAKKLGTTSSKKKKAAKVKRVQAAVRKAARRDRACPSEAFAAIQLLHDPQDFAERLFARCAKGGGERFDTRMAALALVSRCVGVHRLLLLNLYPFLQRFLQPHQRAVPQMLAILVQACHELVPPDVLAPVLRQLVDSFVSDRSRPEVITLGLKTVRELCARCPLVMTPELLQDLALYRKFREKEVVSAARGLISLFRELAPAMLEKRDRGRGADLGATLVAYGAQPAAARVPGADLLQAEQTVVGADAEPGSTFASESCAGGSEEWSDAEVARGEEEDSRDHAGGGLEEGGILEDKGEAGGGEEAESAEEAGPCASGCEEEGGEVEQLLEQSHSEASVSDAEAGREEDTDGNADINGTSVALSDDAEEERSREASGSASEEDEGPAASVSHEAAQHCGSAAGGTAKRRRAPVEDSLQSLKRRLTKVQHGKQRAAQNEGDDAAAGAAQVEGTGAGDEEPLEHQRILTPADFERIRELRHQALVDAVMRKHGLKSAAKRERLLSAAQDEADEALLAQDTRAIASQQRVDPDSLVGRHKRRKDKAERLASVLEGRQGHEYGAAAARAKKKTGGLSNREKSKRKNMPAAARAWTVKKRGIAKRMVGPKNFRGHVRR